MYCGHCAPCPKGIDVASVTKFLNLARAQGMVPETVREHYGGAGPEGGRMYRLRRMQQALPFRRGRGGKHAPGRGDLRRIVCGKGRLLKNRTAAERAGIKGVFVI